MQEPRAIVLSFTNLSLLQSFFLAGSQQDADWQSITPMQVATAKAVLIVDTAGGDAELMPFSEFEETYDGEIDSYMFRPVTRK